MAGLLRLFTIVSRIPETSKIIYSNFKFENTHVLESNNRRKYIRVKKKIKVPMVCNRLLLEEEIEESSFLVF